MTTEYYRVKDKNCIIQTFSSLPEKAQIRLSKIYGQVIASRSRYYILNGNIHRINEN